MRGVQEYYGKAAAEGLFPYCREPPSDMAAWRQLLFRREGD